MEAEPFASCPPETSGSTSRSGTGSAVSSRTPRESYGSGRATPGPSCATSPSFAGLAGELPPRSAIDGEIVIVRDGVLDFDAMQTRLHPAESRVRKLSAEIPATFVAFDLLVWDGVSALARAARGPPSLARVARVRVRALPDDARPRRGPRMGLGLRVDRPRRRDRETARQGLCGGRARRGGKGEAGEDRRLRRRRGALEVRRRSRIATLLLGLYDDEGALDYVGTAAVAPPRSTTRSRPPSHRSCGTHPNSASRSRTDGAAASSRRRPSAPSRRGGQLRQGAGATLPARDEAASAPPRQGPGTVHVARAPPAARARRSRARPAPRVGSLARRGYARSRSTTSDDVRQAAERNERRVRRDVMAVVPHSQRHMPLITVSVTTPEAKPPVPSAAPGHVSPDVKASLTSEGR